MPDQPTDTNRNAIKVALGAALGSALGIITAVRTLSGGQRAVHSEQQVEGSDEVGAHSRTPSGLDAPSQSSVPSPEPFPPQHATGRPDWERLPPAHLPRPTYWPVVLAFAIVLLAWGVVTTLAITVIGLVIFALGLGGWIGELRHGHE
jgi:hypothetical protein